MADTNVLIRSPPYIRESHAPDSTKTCLQLVNHCRVLSGFSAYRDLLLLVGEAIRSEKSGSRRLFLPFD